MDLKPLGRAAGRGALRALILVVRALPMPAALALGRALGRLMRVVSRKRYHVALRNLEVAYGEALSPEERERIARASFVSFGMFAVEGVKFAYMSPAEAARRIQVEGWDHAEAAFAEGRGVLALSGHIGNFEIAARWVTLQGHELIALAREARDRGTTRLMRSMRERMGIRVVTLKESLRPVLAGLRRNACIVIICDQNATDVVVPFFGRPTGTVDGPARIALGTGAPIVLFCCVRDGRGGYRLLVQPAFHPVQTGDKEADILRTTAEINRRLEEMVRAFPEQWLWFHDRWRSSPSPAAETTAASA